MTRSRPWAPLRSKETIHSRVCETALNRVEQLRNQMGSLSRDGQGRQQGQQGGDNRARVGKGNKAQGRDNKGRPGGRRSSWRPGRKNRRWHITLAAIGTSSGGGGGGRVLRRFRYGK